MGSAGAVEQDPPTCSEHPEAPARVRCDSCGRWLCGECHRFTVDGMPWCASCVRLVQNEKQRFPLSFVLTVLLLALGAVVFFVRRGIFGYFWAGFTLLTVLVFALIVASALGAERSLLSRRIVEVVDGEQPKKGRLSAAARRVLRGAVPSVSAKSTVLILVTCFAFTAAFVPAAFKLPPVAEIELVLLGWFAALWVTLSLLLYRNARLGNDYQPQSFLPNFGRVRRHVGIDNLGVGCDGPCLLSEWFIAFWVAGAIVLLALAGAWFLVEALLPALFFLIYVVLRSALTRVVNDTHDCAASLPRSVGWGLLWSALYTAPVALCVFAFHWALAQRGQ